MDAELYYYNYKDVLALSPNKISYLTAFLHA